jgi:hypothetical protein
VAVKSCLNGQMKYIPRCLMQSKSDLICWNDAPYALTKVRNDKQEEMYTNWNNSMLLPEVPMLLLRLLSSVKSC